MGALRVGSCGISVKVEDMQDIENSEGADSTFLNNGIPIFVF